METWIKWILGIIGGGSIIIGFLVLILFIAGDNRGVQEVKEINPEIEKSINQATGEVATSGKTVIGQLNEDRKKAVENEKDPNVRSMINIIYLFVICFMIYVFVVIILALTGLKDKIQI